MEEKITCPCCNKEMKISRSPFYGFYHTECNYCHIFITTKNLHDTSHILNSLYCGQYDFEVKYIDGKIEYARIGGGYRPPITSVDKGKCYECSYQTETCQEGLHCPREVE